MNAAPTSGRKVTSERSGQWLTAMFRRSPREEVPRHDRDEPDHHCEGVMIEIPGLQAAGLSRQVAGDCGDTVWAETVDDRAVAGPPQAIAEQKSGPHKQPVIQIVEVPF